MSAGITPEGAHDYEFVVPAEWYLLPSTPEVAESWHAAVVDSFDIPPVERERLFYALRSVTAVAQDARRRGRPHWAFIPSPASGRVEALLSIGLLEAGDDALSRYEALARAETNVSEDVELVRRVVERRRLPAGQAVTVQDFVAQPAPGGGMTNPAVERGILALFPDGDDQALEYAIMTQNLSMFPELIEYLVELVSSVHEVETSAS